MMKLLKLMHLLYFAVGYTHMEEASHHSTNLKSEYWLTNELSLSVEILLTLISCLDEFYECSRIRSKHFIFLGQIHLI